MQETPPRLNAETLDSVQSDLAELWKQVRPITINQINQIESVLVAVEEHTLDPAHLKMACRSAHQLAGSVGSFGFVTASELAQQLDTLLQQLPELSPSEHRQTLKLLSALRQLIEAE